MARARKANIDYFPHDCTHGKTIFILESQYGNDGYATWFKLLEQLGNSPGHFIDLRNRAEVLHTSARCRVSPEQLIQIINTLAELDAIDAGLWRGNVVFSGGLVQRIVDAYRKRINDLPSREKVFVALNLSCEFPIVNPPEKPANPPEKCAEIVQSAAGMPQRERERERERERKDKSMPASPAEEMTHTEKALRACMHQKRSWLTAKYPGVDIEVETEEMAAKYRGESIGCDPFIIISRWFKNLQVRASDEDNRPLSERMAHLLNPEAANGS